MKKNSKTEDLLRVLGQKPLPAAPEPKPEPAAKRAPAPARAARSPRPQKRSAGGAPRAARGGSVRGKAVTVYFHDQDQKLIHELSAWLASQRRRINDSLVIKSVLRAAKTNAELLAGYDAAVKVDGRTRPKP
jgi:hypothetical protein